ncbi:peptidoglycan D,D-transpeptidase FtsI family protein [Canibacter oris]|uniref:Peptidoglycan glycosyltransferase n=1 Tax=Canibacter oris TaxID=1365628 RepID=A0A840DK67_9MICO|nr:penicillin-binding transpeptidase domain-containing protein [Canibacter oris]MBB4072093.1 peptidoglycan glycosyltransferase [Canibacter oris]
MNKQLKHVSRAVFVMFLALFVALTTIQVVNADSLRAHELNRRTLLNSYQVERGSILVENTPIAISVPSDDEYRFYRQYPQGELYAPITGYFSHYQGSTGIESALNKQLSGTAENQFFTRIGRILSGQDPQGSSVQLTINPAAQQAAADALKDLKGAVVAMDPTTGEILALASSSSYDPNLLSGHDNATIIENYQQLLEDPNQPLANRAIAGDLYVPGSTFKILTTAAALESGKYNLQSTFPDPASYQLPNSTVSVHNAWNGVCGDGNQASLETAFIKSCNIPFAELTNQMDASALPQIASKFGFEQQLEIPLQVTPSSIGKPVDGAQLALTSIGQFDVRVTPLQMASVTAAVVNQGERVQPNLVRDIITPDLRSEYTYRTESLGQAVKPETAAALKSVMTKSVTDPQGLAHQAAIANATVGGKTGTAEVGLDANGNPLPYNLWFTGFAERGNKKVVVAVVVEESGGPLHNYQAGSSGLPTIIGKQVMEAVLGQ